VKTSSFKPAWQITCPTRLPLPKGHYEYWTPDH
jgi:hypothetical protein